MPVYARAFVFLLPAICMLNLQCGSGKSATATTQREVTILSEGYNAAWGHHMLHLSNSEVKIDTSYYRGEWELFAGADTTYFYKHLNTFNTDMTVSVNRSVYEKLLTLPIDTLRAYETILNDESRTTGYSFQEITITENGKTHKLNFHVHVDRSWLPGNVNAFTTGLHELFPFSRRCIPACGRLL